MPGRSDFYSIIDPTSNQLHWLFADSATANVELLSGELVCLHVVNEGGDREGCGTDRVNIPDLTNDDVVYVKCPQQPSAQYDLTTLIPLNIYSAHTQAFQQVIVQIGCDAGNPCLTYMASGRSLVLEELYPVASPPARLRIMLLSEGLPGYRFFARYPGAPGRLQCRRPLEWVEIVLPYDPASILLDGFDLVFDGSGDSCMALSPGAGVPVSLWSYCDYDFPVLVGVPQNPDFLIFRQGRDSPSLGDASAAGIPNLMLSALNGQPLCVDTRSLGNLGCTNTGFMIDVPPGDVISFGCSRAPPPAPDLSGAASINFETSGSCLAVIIQIGCQEPDGTCELRLQSSTIQYPGGPLRFKGAGLPGSPGSWSQLYVTITYERAGYRSYVQPRGQWITVDEGLRERDAKIVVECDIPPPGPQVTVLVIDTVSNCPDGPPFIQRVPWTSESYWDLRPRMTTRVIVYSDDPTMTFERNGELCVIIARDGSRVCGTDRVTVGGLANNDYLTLECPAPPQPEFRSYVYNNGCPTDDTTPGQYAVLVSKSGGSYGLIMPIRSASSFLWRANDPTVSFTPMSGTSMCASSDPSGREACGSQFFTLGGLIEGDAVYLRCLGRRPPPPDLSRTIPLQVYRSGNQCRDAIVQIGCEDGNFCIGEYVASYYGRDHITMQYPMLSPMARVRGQIVETRGGNNGWSVVFHTATGDILPAVFPQRPDTWTEFEIPAEATEIFLDAICDGSVRVSEVSSASSAMPNQELTSGVTSETSSPATGASFPAVVTTSESSMGTFSELTTSTEGSPSAAATSQTETASATQPATEPTSYALTAFNNCPAGNPVIINIGTDRDLFVISPDSTESINIASSARNFSFTPLNGHYLCALSRETGQMQCAYDFARFELTQDDHFDLSCPTGTAVTFVDISRYVPVTIEANAECPMIIRQMGCEPRTSAYCIVDVLPNPYPYTITFDFPARSDQDKFTLRIAGPGWNSYRYLTTFEFRGGGGGASSASVARGQALGVDVAAQDVRIHVKLDCSINFLPPPPPRLLRPSVYTAFENELQYWAGTPTSGPDLLILTGNTSLTVWSNAPEAYFAPIQGGQLCVTSDLTATTSCGYDSVTVRDIVLSDRLFVSFPEPRPPAPDMTNTIPLRLVTLAAAGDGTVSCVGVAFQIGCEEGAYCLGRGYSSSAVDETVAYPLLSPMARLRVKAGGSNTRRVEWEVGYSYGELISVFEYTQLRGEWLYPLSADMTGVQGLELRATCYNSLPTAASSTTSLTTVSSAITTESISLSEVTSPSVSMEVSESSLAETFSPSTSESQQASQTNATPEEQPTPGDTPGPEPDTGSGGETGSEEDPDTGPIPVTYYQVTTSNRCPLEAPVILGTPQERDSALLDSAEGSVGVYSSDPRLFFEPLSGRETCAGLQRTGYNQCTSTGVVEVPDLLDNDEVTIDCSAADPSLPDTGDVIPVVFALDPAYQQGITQVGCLEGSYCLSYHNTERVFVVDYPLLSPMARLRFKTLGVHTSTEWTHYFNFGQSEAPEQYTQSYTRTGEWLEFLVPIEASSIRVWAYCFPKQDAETTTEPTLTSITLTPETGSGSSPVTTDSSSSSLAPADEALSLSSTLSAPDSDTSSSPTTSSSSIPVLQATTTSSTSSTPTPSSSATAPSREVWTVNARTACRSNALPILYNQNRILFAGTSASDVFALWSDTPTAALYPLTGGPLCVISQKTNEQWCAAYGDSVNAVIRSNRDELLFVCTDPRPALPDVRTFIPLSVRSGVAPNAAPCYDLAIQIGCIPESYCLAHAYNNFEGEFTNRFIQLKYPYLATQARLCIKLGVVRATWSITYYEDTTAKGIYQRDQLSGQWLDVTEFIMRPSQPENAQILLQAACYSS